jgi:hypothetical protein
MTTTINALTTGGGGAVVTGDSSGALALQTNNGTTALSIDTSQNITLGTAGSTTTIPANIVATTSNQTVSLSPTGTGTVTISPAGTLTMGTAGATHSMLGNISAVTSNQTIALSPTGTGTVAISPVGALTINPTAASTINNTSIGGTTAAAGTFTALSATSRTSGSVLAKSAGQTALQTLTLSGSSQAFTVNMAGQTLSTNQTYRVRAYGTLAAISSVNVRQVQFTPIWGATSLTSLTSSAVLSATAQTTNWQLEFTLTASSATAIWTTGQLISRVSSATSIVIDAVTPASVGSLTSASTLTIGVISSGTATADVLNIQSVIIERLI